MSAHPEDCPLALDAPHTVRAVRAVLDEAGYSAAHVLELLQVRELPSIAHRMFKWPLYERRLRVGPPLRTLLQLFLFNQPVPAEEAREAVRPTRLEDWAELGLVRLEGDAVAARFELVPYYDLLLVVDLPGASELMWKQFVMGPGGSTESLDRMTVRRPAGRGLDLGTGCGVLALRAAAHCTEVAAVDRNPRAVRLASFNAQLNGRDNVCCLQGDFFEPVRDQAFDLIVGNLPFVMSPHVRYVFRDSPMPGDGLAQTVVRTAAGVLRPGGYGELLATWVHRRGQDPAGRLAAWVGGTGCDAWVLRMQTLDAADYAAEWVAQAEGPDLRSCRDEFNEWVAYYEREGIEAISTGFFLLRAAPGRANRFWYEDLPPSHGPCGESVARRFELHDFLERAGDDRVLLETRLRASPDLRWQQELRPAGDGWSVIESQLRLAGGLAFGGNADRNVVTLVMGCQGTEPLRNVLAAFAAAKGTTLDNLAPACLDVVRRLIADGHLLPAEEPTGPGGATVAPVRVD